MNSRGPRAHREELLPLSPLLFKGVASSVILAALLVPHAGGQDRRGGVLARKWEYKIQERVYLPTPSGWHSTLPWAVSSPALGNLGFGGDDLEVVTGTEEGYFEWFPKGQDSGRYIALDSKGKHLWDYRTQNNAGRAPPAMADADGDGALDITGGSTCGWMVHLFNGRGERRWRYEVANQANVLAPPAMADLTEDAGLETVAVALDGRIYALSSEGRLLWRSTPVSNVQASAAGPAIADVDNDGRPDVIVVMPGKPARVFCLDGRTGVVKWESEGLGAARLTMACPAILPKADPCWRQSSLGRDAGTARIIVPCVNAVYCLAGGNGRQVWKYATASVVASSPAIGDVDGDGTPEVVFGDGRELVCLNAFTGKREWACEVGGMVYSSPALADRSVNRPHRLEWPMFRHDAARTGFYGFQRGPLGIYVGSDAGFLHLIDGKSGQEIDKFAIKFPDLVIVQGNHGALRFMSSPSIADLDGNGTLEAVFTLVDRVWCVEDTASNVVRPKEDLPPVQLGVESTRRNVTPTKNHFALAQVVHAGGWNPQVPMHQKLLEELTKRANMSVLEEMVPVSLRDDDVSRFPFLYMTGHEAVAFHDEEVKRLQGHLDRGAFVFAEACCNSEAFEKSVRTLAAKLSSTPLARVKADHPIFNRVYDIKEVTLKGKPVAPEFHALERKGRIVFLFTNHDYGCSWGNPCCTSGCSGVTSEDSYRMMTNMIAYALLE